ncbi:MAG: SigB/SigF/SigG family RNA polymerase sigma factor [Acidimicrobiales bacterium]
MTPQPPHDHVGRDRPSRAELKARFEEYRRTGDLAIRDSLVEAYLGLGEYLARRFANRGESLDDLVQVASLALVSAVDRFDPERGIEFTTFATHTVVGELKRHFRDRGWAIRAPRRMQELYLTLGQVTPTLAQRLQRSPTIAELALESEASEEEVLEAIEAGQAYRLASLDSPTMRTGEHLGSQIGTHDEGFEHAERRATLEPLLATLPDRERRIVALRFFEGLSQTEIASDLGISQMHVSRLLARSIAALRATAQPGS